MKTPPQIIHIHIDFLLYVPLLPFETPFKKKDMQIAVLHSLLNVLKYMKKLFHSYLYNLILGVFFSFVFYKTWASTKLCETIIKFLLNNSFKSLKFVCSMQTKKKIRWWIDRIYVKPLMNILDLSRDELDNFIISFTS